MEDVYDSFLASFDASIFEEVVYRLFIMSCLLFLFQHLYQNIKAMWPVLVSVLPRAMALVLSSLLFAVAHNVLWFYRRFLRRPDVGIHIYEKRYREGDCGAFRRKLPLLQRFVPVLTRAAVGVGLTSIISFEIYVRRGF